MKTIVLERPGHFSAEETCEPAPSDGHAIVRVRRVGICGTDLHAFRGDQPFFDYPRVLGHELGVEIVEIPDSDCGLKPGDRCAVEPYLDCGRCIACRRGKSNCCEHLAVLGVHVDGGMRELIAIPIRKLHRSPSLSLDQLALVETLGIGAHAVGRAQIEPGEWTLIIGAGPIGLSVIQHAVLARARVIVVETNERRLEFCRSHFGVQTAAPSDALADRLVETTSDSLPVAVFDATGDLSSMSRAIQYVAHGGRVVFVGVAQGNISVYDADLHRKEVALLATRNSTGADFRHVIDLMESGQIDPAPWITHRAAAGDMIGEFAGWMRPESGVIKAVVHF